MTGKLADKLPLTMSSLINTIPDSLYPEEDIPTSMNIFTNTDSINHYTQMNTGKHSLLYLGCDWIMFYPGFVVTTARLSCGDHASTATVVLERAQRPSSRHLFALRAVTHIIDLD